MKPATRPSLILLAFILVCLAWRALFLPVCRSSYTDGIMQIDMFRLGVSFWPPLYALLARLFAWVPGLGLEGSARLVSLLCGAALLWPLYEIARRLFGFRAALWSMAAWIATPLAHQWSLQVMTDMPFAFFWMAALASLLLAVESCVPGLFPGIAPSEARGLSPSAPASTPNPRRGAQWLLAASFCGALGTLTRYQGVLLFPLLLVAAWRLARVTRALPAPRGLNPWLTLLPWLAVPAWLLQGASSISRHADQIGARAGMSPMMALLNYAYLFEEFLLKSPYFLTYGIFGFMLYGLFRTQWATARLRWAGWACLGLALALFAMQAVFTSWQARYLLPLVPLACLFAGHGLATWERHTEKRPLLRWGLVLPALGWGLVFSALVAVFQGSPFLDIKQAAQYVKENLPGRRLWTNEYYNQELGPIKVGFWAGRLAEEWSINPPPPKPGDVIVYTSYNIGNLEEYRRVTRDLMRNLPAREHARFGRVALPLITDIMAERGTAQNPLAWQLRYMPQYFESSVLEILPRPEDKPTSATQLGTEPLKPIPPLSPSGDLDKLRQIQKELNIFLDTKK